MTIRAKLIIANVVVFGIILFVVAAVVYNSMRESEIAKIDSHLETYAVSFITEFEDQWENHEFPESDEIEALAVPPLADIRIQLLDNSGRVVYRRGELPPLPGNLLDQALGDVSAWQNVKIGSGSFRRLVRPVETDDRIGFVLVLATANKEIDERLAMLIIVLTLTLSGALLISAIGVYLLTGRAFRPITRMVEAAEKISALTLHQRLKVPAGRDEVSRLAEALNQMIERIEDAFKSQRQFVSDASHELRTPLTVVYSELEFLKRQIKEERLNESIEASLHEIDRLANLVQQLLLLARIDARKLSIERQAVRLDEAIANCVRLLRARADADHIAIELSVGDVVEIEGDAGHLERALINVIDNAIAYSPQGSEVVIQLRRESRAAIVTISDRGPGISEEETELVFKRFYRSPRARQTHDGSGLGLAIARELVQAHGGQISVGSRESGGATVTISLPLKQQGSQTP